MGTTFEQKAATVAKRLGTRTARINLLYELEADAQEHLSIARVNNRTVEALHWERAIQWIRARIEGEQAR